MNSRPTSAPTVASHGWIQAAVIALAVIAVYWPVWRGEFVWDDRLVLDKNPLVTGKLNLGSVWFRTDFPLSTVAFWLQWLVWGKAATGYHVVNLLLHAAGALFLWRVLERLKVPGAWLGALIFALHPVCASSVAWISEMKNTLSLCFLLLSLRWFLRSEELEAPTHLPASRALVPYGLSLGAFLLALLSKTSTVMLPVVLLACAWWQRGRLTLRDLRRTAPFFALSLVFGLMTVWFQKHQAMAGAVVQSEGFFGRLAGAGRAVWFYLGKALAPVHLNMIYPRWTIDAKSPLAYVPVCLLIAAFVVCWRFRHAWGRNIFFVLVCFVVLLFPTLGFFDMYFLALSLVSDHFQYLALIPVAASVAAWLFGNSPHNRDAGSPAASLPVGRIRLASATLVVVLLSFLTMQRARVIAHDESLWRDTLAKNPSAWTAHNNLGCLLAEKNEVPEAVRHFEAALDLQPRNAQAHANLARALALQNRFVEAEQHLQAALETKPDDADVHRAYAQVLAGQGKLNEALPHLRDALRSEPDLATRLQYAGLLFQTRDSREAVLQYRQVLVRKPDLVEALNNLAWILATCPDATIRNGAEAVRNAEHAVQLTESADPVPLGTLAAAYAEAGRFDEAVTTAERAIDRATATGNAQFAAINRQLLKNYRAGKAFHETPR